MRANESKSGMSVEIVLIFVIVLVGLADSTTAQVVAYRGGTLIDGNDGEPTADAVLIVENGKINAVGSATVVEIPERASVVDLSGRFVMPGMIDTHVHFMESGRLQDLRYYRIEIPGVPVSKRAEERWFRDRPATNPRRHSVRRSDHDRVLGRPEESRIRRSPTQS